MNTENCQLGSVDGMTLRDHFALNAPIGLDHVPDYKLVGDGARSPLTNAQKFALLAALRYAYADAMLSARK